MMDEIGVEVEPLDEALERAGGVDVVGARGDYFLILHSLVTVSRNYIHPVPMTGPDGDFSLEYRRVVEMGGNRTPVRRWCNRTSPGAVRL